MEDNPITQTESLSEILGDLLNILLSIISRPAVLQQLLAIVLILLVAWLLPEAYFHWRRTRQKDERGADSQTYRQVWLSRTYRLLSPLITLVLLNLAIVFFSRQGYPNGLLENLTIVILTWLIFRILQMILYARYGEAAKPYFNRILTPLFLLIIVWETLGILPAFVVFTNVNIGFGTISISLGNLFTALLVFYLFFTVAWILQRVTEGSLLQHLQAEPGLIESMTTLIRYSIIGLGIFISLSLMGFDLTSLAIVAGGLSVGIGIGLQDIVSNFISGLILLFEQSLRPGDVIQLDGRIVKVESIGLRATSVRTRSNEEVIIPNAAFTTQQVTNLTRTDSLVRILVPLGVSYASNPELVRQISIETAKQHPQVLDDPPALLLFEGFGESSLNFILVVSINQPEITTLVRSDLYYMLVKAFAEHDIEIPFPQRDLNLGEGWEKLVEGYQKSVQ